MRKHFFATLTVSLLAGAVCAQSVPDSELVARIKANRSHFSELDRGPNLEKQAANLGQDISADRSVSGNPGLCGGCAPPDPNNDPDVKRATAESDLIVIGEDVRNISSLTENKAFVFTDSEFIISEIWKDTGTTGSAQPLAFGSEITITTPGGVARSGGHRIEASLSHKAPMRAGHQYLMYLRYLPDSRSYAPVGLGGFDISKLAVAPLWTLGTSPAQQLMSNKLAFIQALHSSTLHAIEQEK
ncbi:MAG: hypothetical protein HIU91_09895 [Acidobacteria bacterium]|nr:hypothetical protein [Acidobacteriota bacterium]